MQSVFDKHRTDLDEPAVKTGAPELVRKKQGSVFDKHRTDLYEQSDPFTDGGEFAPELDPSQVTVDVEEFAPEPVSPEIGQPAPVPFVDSTQTRVDAAQSRIDQAQPEPPLTAESLPREKPFWEQAFGEDIDYWRDKWLRTKSGTLGMLSRMVRAPEPAIIRYTKPGWGLINLIGDFGDSVAAKAQVIDQWDSPEQERLYRAMGSLGKLDDLSHDGLFALQQKLGKRLAEVTLSDEELKELSKRNELGYTSDESGFLGNVAQSIDTAFNNLLETSGLLVAASEASKVGGPIGHSVGFYIMYTAEAGSFMAHSEHLDVPHDFVAPYSELYGGLSGAVEYAQKLMEVRLFKRNKGGESSDELRREAIKKLAATSFGKRLLRRLRDVGIDGLEEMTQGGLEYAIVKKMAADYEQAFGVTIDPQKIGSPDLFENFLAGVSVAGLGAAKSTIMDVVSDEGQAARKVLDEGITTETIDTEFGPVNVTGLQSAQDLVKQQLKGTRGRKRIEVDEEGVPLEPVQGRERTDLDEEKETGAGAFPEDSVEKQIFDAVPEGARDRVTVVKTSADFPPEALAEARRRGLSESDLDAVFHRDEDGVGQVYFAENRLTDPQKLKDVVFEEVTIHLGLSTSLGKEKLEQVSQQIWESLTDEERAEVADRQKLEELPGETQEQAGRRTAAIGEEWLAQEAIRVVRSGQTNSVWTKIADSLRRALRSIGISKRFSDTEIADLIAKGTAAAAAPAAPAAPVVEPSDIPVAPTETTGENYWDELTEEQKAELGPDFEERLTSPDVWAGLEEGKPTKLRAFHGKGAAKSDKYAPGADGPALGEGRYSALDSSDAKEFGEVESVEVQLENPVVITADQDLSRWMGGKPLPSTNEERTPLLKAARQRMEDAGHDGVIINVPAHTDSDTDGRSIKRLREIFGGSQVLEFSPPAATVQIARQRTQPAAATEAEKREKARRARRLSSSVVPEKENIAEFRKTYPYIRMPKATDPLRTDLVGTRKDPSSIRGRFRAKNPDKAGAELLAWDQILIQAHEAMPEVITAEDLNNPEALEKIYKGRLETRGQRAAKERKLDAEQAEEAEIEQTRRLKVLTDIGPQPVPVGELGIGDQVLVDGEWRGIGGTGDGGAALLDSEGNEVAKFGERDQIQVTGGEQGIVRNEEAGAFDFGENVEEEGTTRFSVTRNDPPVRKKDDVAAFNAETQKGIDRRKPKVSLAYPIDAAKNVLRLLNRKDTDVGIHQDRKVIGEGADQMVVGRITPDDWKTRTLRTLTKKEILESRRWYTVADKEFKAEFSADSDLWLMAWLMANQNASPANALQSALKVKEQLNRGFQESRGGLAHDRLVAMFTGQDLGEKGIGRKIYDFIDSAHRSVTRTLYGDDARAGSPAVIDVHSARDTGYVDKALYNKLVKRYGKAAVKAAGIEITMSGAPGEQQYEGGAEFLRDLAEQLSAEQWLGIKNWKPHEVQAVGWTSMSTFMASATGAEGAVDIIEANVRKVSFKLSFGEGSPLDKELGKQFNSLPLDRQIKLTRDLMTEAVKIAAEISGVRTPTAFFGTGAWMGDLQANGQADLLASKKGADLFADVIGYLSQQAEVWVTRPTLAKNGKATLDIMAPELSSVETSEKVWAALRERVPLMAKAGFSPIVENGVPGIRVITGRNGQAGIKAITGKLQPALQEVGDELGIDLDLHPILSDVTVHKNDWKENADGKSYLTRIRSLAGTKGETRVRDSLGKEFAQRVRDAVGTEVTSDVRSEVDRQGTQESEPEVTPTTRFSVTPAQDATYMAAAEKGDTKTAKRMVDSAAKKAGYTVKVYRGDAEDFVVFKESMQGKNFLEFDGVFPRGFFWFTTSKENAEWYAGVASRRKGTPVVREFYLNPGNVFEHSAEDFANEGEYTVPGDKIELKRDHGEGFDSMLVHADAGWKWISEVVRDEAGRVIKGPEAELNLGDYQHRAVTRPAQIKLANPITRDDSGVIIPLSQRFDPDSADIRFSVTPAQDATYLAAAEKGDTKTAKRMVDSAAKKAGYTVDGLFKGMPREAVQFSEGAWLAEDPEVAKAFASLYRTGSTRPYVVKPGRTADIPSRGLDPGVIQYGAFVDSREYGLPPPEAQKFRSAIEDSTVDVIKLTDTDVEGTIWFVKDGRNVKLADPITRDDDGNVIPLSERFNPERSDTRFSVTPAQDAAHLAAAEKGDTKTAKRMVDSAAKKAGLQRVYRGASPDQDQAFRIRESRPVHFVAFDKNEAQYYADEITDGVVFDLFADLTKPMKLMREDSNVSPEDALKRLKAGGVDVEGLEFDDPGGFTEFNFVAENTDALKERLLDAGYTSVIGVDPVADFADGRNTTRPIDAAILLDKSQIKSADPVTRDADGNVIPLSQRFNPERDDTRFSVTPESPPSPDGERLRIEEEILRRQREGQHSVPPGKVSAMWTRVKQSVAARAPRIAVKAKRVQLAFKTAAIQQRAKRAQLLISEIRQGLIRAGHSDDDIQRDLNRVLGEEQFQLGGEEFSRDDLHRMSRDELVSLVLGAGGSIAGNASKEVAADAVMSLATPQRMDTAAFTRQYGLSVTARYRLDQFVEQATKNANELEQLMRDAGIEVTGGFVGGNELYSRRLYLRDLTKSYKPSATAIKDAVTFTANGIDKAISRLEKRATKLADKGADMVAFFQDGDRAHIAKLTDKQKEKAHAMRRVFDSLGTAKDSVGRAPSGDVQIRRNAQGIVDAAEFFVSEIMEPRTERGLDGVATGMGRATDALLHRDLKKVFRELFGEYKDPAHRFATSREGQEFLITNLRNMSALSRVTGLSSDTKQEGMRHGHSVRLGSSQLSTAVTTSGDLARYGMLAGKWVHPSVARELRALPNKEGRLAWANKVFAVMNKAGGVVRGIAVLRPAAIMRDIGTNVSGFAMGAGDVNPTFLKEYGKALNSYGKLIRGIVRRKLTGNATLEARAREELGAIADKELFRAGQSSMVHGIEDALGEGGPVGEKWNALMTFRSTVADMPVKVAAYHSRLAKLQRWYRRDLAAGAVTQADLEQMAKDHVAARYDNRDAIPDWYKHWAQKWYMPDFMQFKYSSTRAVLNNFVGLVRDSRNPRVPLKDKVSMSTQLSMSLSMQGFVATAKAGPVAAAVTGLANMLSDLHGDEVEELEIDEEKSENAFRYFMERYYAYDPITVLKSANGKFVRIVWSGSISPFAILGDLPIGFIDTDDPQGVGTVSEELLEAIVGGGLPMNVKNLHEFTKNVLGENGVLDSWIQSAAKDADQLASNKVLSDAIEKTWVDAAKGIGGWYGRVLTSSVDIRKHGERMERSLSKPVESDGVVTREPKGIAPTDHYTSSRAFGDILLSGFLPVKFTAYERSDIRANILWKARNFRYDWLNRSRSESLARETMTKDEKRKKDTEGLAGMEEWRKHSEFLLTHIGEANVPLRQADILKKAGYANWQVEHITGVDPKSHMGVSSSATR